MKIYLLIFCLLSGCAPMHAVNQRGETIVTPTRCYNAAKAVALSQEEVNGCIKRADVIFWDKISTGPGIGLNCVEAGNAFDNCVKR